jgi:glycosyltransferase involved in cell wall biosynthesis
MNKHKKIAIYISENKFIGGAHQYTENLIIALSKLPKNKFKLFAIFQDEAHNFKLNKRFKKIYIKENNLQKILSVIYSRVDKSCFRNKKFNNYFYNKIKKINKLHLDLIIFPTQDRESFLVQSKALVSIHDLMHRYEKKFKEYQNGEFERRERKYRLICKCANNILADSYLGKKHILDSYSIEKNKIHILPYVPQSFSNCSKEKNNLPIPKNFFFYPAQFWEHKNHANLIKAFKIFIEKYPKYNMKLILAGSKKNNYNKTVELIHDLKLEKEVLILGYINKNLLKSLYKSAKSLIFVSFCGPTNIPPLEAISLGCPIICADVYGMKKQLGKTSLYVNPNNPNDISKKMFKILDKKVLKKLFSYYKKSKKINNQNIFNKNLFKIIKEIS